MGQLIYNSTIISGTYSPTLISNQSNVVTLLQPFMYIRIGNVVTCTGNFAVELISTNSDEIQWNALFVGSFTDANQVQGVYSLERPHIAFSTPNNMGPVQFLAVTGSDNISFNFNSIAPTALTYVFSINIQYIIP